MQSLIGSSPTVTVHQGHVKTHDRPMVYQNRFNETALSEQSFADLSLISGDVSVQVIEGAKRTKNWVCGGVFKIFLYPFIIYYSQA